MRGAVERFGGAIIANETIDRDSTAALIENGVVDLVSFGRLFISNPDLVERFRKQSALTAPDANTFQSPGPDGYIEYPKPSD